VTGPALQTRDRTRAAARTDPGSARRRLRGLRIASVGEAFDNALAESCVDSFKTELIADRVWRTRAQLELAVVEYVG
jgi:hypothetical protein